MTFFFLFYSIYEIKLVWLGKTQNNILDPHRSRNSSNLNLTTTFSLPSNNIYKACTVSNSELVKVWLFYSKNLRSGNKKIYFENSELFEICALSLRKTVYFTGGETERKRIDAMALDHRGSDRIKIIIFIFIIPISGIIFLFQCIIIKHTIWSMVAYSKVVLNYSLNVKQHKLEKFKW